MMKLLDLLILCCLIFTGIVCSVTGTMVLSDEKRLVRDILRDYDSIGKIGRPVTSKNDTVTVYYGMSLIQILDLDERNQVLTTNVWASYEWNDKFLTWNASLYDDIGEIRVPTSRIWMPDIKLYNYADVRLEERRKTLAIVYSNGKVVWIPQAVFKSSCSVDIMNFPFDEQTCVMKFGSWTYDGTKVDIEFLNNIQHFEMTNYIHSNEWEILNSTAQKNSFYYHCCPEPYPDLTFTLHIQRKMAFYSYILILPCVLLSSLTLVLFWLPPESPAKMQLGMNIFVAFFVLLLLLAESTPPAASDIPLIGAYYCLNMVLITLSTFLSVVIVNLYFHGPRSRVPVLVKKLLLGFFGTILCMRAQLVEDSPDPTESPQNKLNKYKREKNHLNEFKYDKVATFEVQRDDPWKIVTNGTNKLKADSEVYVEPSPTHIHILNALEMEVKDIKRHLRIITDKILEKDGKEKISKEWKLVAIVMDRVFFVFYIFVIAVSVCFVFRKSLWQGK